jgi:hypothetical protein
MGVRVGNVQGGADTGTAAHDHAAATEGAAVAVDRCDPDQGCDLAAIEGGAEFGQLGDQNAGRGLADARCRGEHVLGGAPGWSVADRVVEVGLKRRELLLQPRQMGVERPGPGMVSIGIES